jgi:uncharacterized protein (TIGR03435 family)
MTRTILTLLSLGATALLAPTARECRAQTQKPALSAGQTAPDLTLEELLQAPANATTNWAAFKGKVVVIEFWAAWCSPCIAAMPHLNQLADEFKDQPVVFISVTDDERERVDEFLKSKPIKGWVGRDPKRENWKKFDIHSIPHTVIVGADGKVAGITSPEHVTSAVIRDVLAGKAITLPSKVALDSDLEWDQTQIEWKDGVPPVAEILIKPIKTATGGSWVRPDQGYLTADGAGAESLFQIAYSTDFLHLDWRLPPSDQAYRVAARVPKGRESQLLPFFQSALAATFGADARWEKQEKEVYVLRVPPGGKALLTASADSQKPFYAVMRGKASAKRQQLSQLTEWLTNTLRLPVVDETGLTGSYDWELTYQPGQPNVAINGVKEKLGLELVKARRTIDILVVRPAPLK